MIFLLRKQFAKNFMEKEIKRLESELDKWPQNAHIHAALGSFHEKLGNIDTASSHLNKAVSLLGKKDIWRKKCIYLIITTFWNNLYTYIYHLMCR